MESQLENIKKHLLNGSTITPLEALNMFGCFRLSDVIFKLRNQGLNISMELIKMPHKKGKGFAKYTLIV
jgi:hypothetical protein